MLPAQRVLNGEMNKGIGVERKGWMGGIGRLTLFVFMFFFCTATALPCIEYGRIQYCRLWEWGDSGGDLKALPPKAFWFSGIPWLVAGRGLRGFV